MTDMTLNGLDGLEAAWVIIANAYGGDWASAPDDWRAAAERWRDEVWHPALDASRVSPDPPLRFDNATAVREIAYRCAGAGSGAVMRLAGDVVMPAAEIGEAVEAILCDFWPEAAERDQAWRWKRGNPYRGHACEGDDCPGCGYESSWNEGFAAGRAAATPDPRDGCRAPHCFSEYGTPCGTCPAEKPETP